MRKRMLLLTVLVVLLISSLVATPVMAAAAFAKNPSNPLITGAYAWEEVWVGAPSVILDGGVYKMWYTGLDDDGYASIGYAESPDGTNWSKYMLPVLTRGSFADWDADGAGMACVIKDGVTYKMWYTGVDLSSLTAGIGYAESTDGINWSKSLANPVLSGGALSWDRDGVALPSVIKENSTYKMWYSGRTNDGTMVGIVAIGYAESSDGTNWTKSLANPVLTASPLTWDARAVGAASVISAGGTGYVMYYTGFAPIGGAISRIGEATSPDGITWSKSTANPVLSEGPTGAWDARGVASPAIVKVSGITKMWYTGAGYIDGDLVLRIGEAETPAPIPSTSTWSLVLLVAGLTAVIAVFGLWRSGRFHPARR